MVQQPFSNADFIHKLVSQLVLQINVGSIPIYSVKIVRAATCSYAKFNDVTNRVMMCYQIEKQGANTSLPVCTMRINLCVAYRLQS